MVWVCREHPDRVPKIVGGSLWCAKCQRSVPDAFMEVPYPLPERVTITCPLCNGTGQRGTTIVLGVEVPAYCLDCGGDGVIDVAPTP